MPSLAPSVRSCGCVVRPGDRCQHMRAADHARKARHDQRRPSARERGYTSDYETERAKFLRANPWCKRCGKRSEVLDHKVPHRGSTRLFWMRSNWQALCKTCHDSWKQSQERRDL